MKAYERRYHRELHDIGMATALAQHDPKALNQAFAPPSPTPAPGPDQREKWW